LPGWICGVVFPLILKSCETWPTFLKTNVTLPGFPIDLVESLKKNSPPLTWIVVAVARDPQSIAVQPARVSTASIRSRSRPPRRSNTY
jgi:hypothetical protein